MRLAVTYTPYAASSKEQTGDVITFAQFEEGINKCNTLAAPEHQEMKGQVEVTWRTLHTIAHSLMVHARVP